MASKRFKSRLCVVYTAIFGPYDSLKEQPKIKGVKYVCFTDQPLKSDTWRIVRVGLNGLSPRLRSKEPKLLPHKWLSPYVRRSLWIDGSISLKDDGLIRFVDGSGFAMVPHPDRDCIYKEIAALKHLKSLAGQDFDAQAKKYEESGWPRNAGLWASGIIYRRHTARARRFGEAWWFAVNTETTRDQISLPPLLNKFGISVRPIHGWTRYFGFTPHQGGDTVMDRRQWLGASRPILDAGVCSDGSTKHLLDMGHGLRMWVPEGTGDVGERASKSTLPHLKVVDGFYRDPDAVRAFALEQEYHEDLRHYKGLRTRERYLWPYLREDLQAHLGGSQITDWLDQPANGCFQQTKSSDPIVWHSDTQDYAAAVYLTPNAPVSAGTSFWRNRTHGCRRPPSHPMERGRFADPLAVQNDVYSPYNLTHGDDWELVDRIGGVYNRLVIWDASLIHSASSYEGFEDFTRLVQLFFFSVRAVSSPPR